jgi:hypothetical protein
MRFASGTLVAVAVACALPSVARANPMVKVRIETEPPKATVYLNSIEDGEKCKETPCLVDVPVGESIAIVVLDGYVKDFIQIDAKRKTAKPQLYRLALARAVGTLKVDESYPKGASVMVDDVDSGKVPVEVELEAGGKHVVVTQNGKKLYDDFIEIQANKTASVPAPKRSSTTTEVAEVEKKKPKPPDDDSDTKIADDPDTGPSVQKTTEPKESTPHEASFAVLALADAGRRWFTYDTPTSANARDITFSQAGAQAMVGGSVEVWPMRVIGGPLRGFSVYGRFEMSPTAQSVSYFDSMMNPVTVTTKWQSWEASARYRWKLGDAGALVAGAGYVHDALEFEGDSNSTANVPGATYDSLRVGPRFSYVGEHAEPYIDLEGRIGFSGGTTATRFPGNSPPEGFRAALGIAFAFADNHFVGRIEGSYLDYGWTFGGDQSMSTYKAKGAADQIIMGSLSLGAAF